MAASHFCKAHFKAGWWLDQVLIYEDSLQVIHSHKTEAAAYHLLLKSQSVWEA